MNKICTSIEQSKKLLELGVNIHTADMFYPNRVGMDNYPLPIEWKKGLPLLSQEIPAWSLSALLELIPNGEKNDENYVDTESHSDFYICTYRNCWDGCIHSEYSEENLLDAVFGMVCWLLENNEL